MQNSYIVFDFETTGLSPGVGDRAIEIAAVLVKDGVITDKFQSLMNPGKRIPAFIESYTGITNSMISKAPSNAVSMKKFSQFIGTTPLIAHNAAFDKKFLDAELGLIGEKAGQPVACSLRVARRLYQDAHNHKLKTLIEHTQIKVSGEFHRALADAEMTAQLWLKMRSDIISKYKLQDASFDFMKLLSQTPKKDLLKFISKHSSRTTLS
ncbi:MAG TPA: 3'-5' exonuclease [Bacteriovoracaceae bacterium]|nr:3'-5' exonuclease [Bacteriovoracaceae bacterium]